MPSHKWLQSYSKAHVGQSRRVGCVGTLGPEGLQETLDIPARVNPHRSQGPPLDQLGDGDWIEEVCVLGGGHLCACSGPMKHSQWEPRGEELVLRWAGICPTIPRKSLTSPSAAGAPA